MPERTLEPPLLVVRRRQSLKTGAAFGVIALSCLAAYWLASAGPKGNAPYQALTVPEGCLRLGEVWEDPNFQMTLPVSNETQHDLEIKKFITTCTCARIDPSSVVISPGETREIHVTLDLAAKSAKGAGLSLREFEAGISPDVASEAGEGVRISWIIQGRVRSAIECEPPVVDFGRVSELAQPLAPARATIKALPSVTTLTTSCELSQFDIRVEKRSSHISEGFDAIVAPRGWLPRGEIRCTLGLLAELRDGQRLPPKKVQVQGNVVADIEPSPRSILLGARAVGSTTEESVILRSLTGNPFAVIGVRCEGAGLSIQAWNQGSSLGKMFRVKQKFDKKGERNTRVIFSVRPEGQKEDEVILPVCLCGIEARPN